MSEMFFVEAVYIAQDIVSEKVSSLECYMDSGKVDVCLQTAIRREIDRLSRCHAALVNRTNEVGREVERSKRARKAKV